MYIFTLPKRGYVCAQLQSSHLYLQMQWRVHWWHLRKRYLTLIRVHPTSFFFLRRQYTHIYFFPEIYVIKCTSSFDRAVFNWVSKIISELLGFALLHSVIGSKFSRHFFSQSEVKPKPIVACAWTFSRALCRLRVILRVLIGLLNCLRPFWLAKVITVVLLLRHSIESRSM